MVVHQLVYVVLLVHLLVLLLVLVYLLLVLLLHNVDILQVRYRLFVEHLVFVLLYLEPLDQYLPDQYLQDKYPPIKCLLIKCPLDQCLLDKFLPVIVVPCLHLG
jgi:hypothetical protein